MLLLNTFWFFVVLSDKPIVLKEWYHRNLGSRSKNVQIAAIIALVFLLVAGLLVIYKYLEFFTFVEFIFIIGGSLISPIIYILTDIQKFKKAFLYFVIFCQSITAIYLINREANSAWSPSPANSLDVSFTFKENEICNTNTYYLLTYGSKSIVMKDSLTNSIDYYATKDVRDFKIRYQ